MRRAWQDVVREAHDYARPGTHLFIDFGVQHGRWPSMWDFLTGPWLIYGGYTASQEFGLGMNSVNWPQGHLAFNKEADVTIAFCFKKAREIA